MIVLGLTGSIGLGKSTTAQMFRDAGAPVWDADAAVHALYGPGGAALGAMAAAFPGVVRPYGVDRALLGERLHGDPEALRKLEEIVHPLLLGDREAFLGWARQAGHEVAVIDVPLLLETGLDLTVDAVVVVSAPEAVQRERVMARNGMTAERLDTLLARQMPDAEKRARADFVIDTARGMDAAREQVAAVLTAVRQSDFRSRRRELDLMPKPIH